MRCVQNPGVYGFETRYGEPVMTTIFYDPARLDRAGIRALIEADEITVEEADGRGEDLVAVRV